MTDLPTPDIDAVAAFLEAVHPGGPWILTSIPVEGGRTSTKTCHDVRAASGWAMAQNNLPRNVYWTTNRTRTAMDVKPKKEHIEEAVFLHVDLDPRKGFDVAEEQARILKQLEDFSPAPSVTVFSGGGYQALWRLDKPFYVGGDRVQAAELEAYNRQLGMVLQGDATFNIDRILRVAGTVNWPNEKKREKGRKPALATLLRSSPDTYPLSAFSPAPPMPTRATTESVELPATLQPVELDDLPATITADVRKLIVHGNDPDAPGRYASMSEPMWRVTMELVRAGSDDAVIASLLLDPRYGVSDHPLRQKNSLDYVARQIERAREFAWMSTPVVAAC